MPDFMSIIWTGILIGIAIFSTVQWAHMRARTSDPEKIGYIVCSIGLVILWGLVVLALSSLTTLF